ncbi:hypothetical protein V6N13_111454 [Hibiscus sabdariffa]
MYWGSVKRKQRKLTKTSLVSRLQVLEDCDPDEETNKTNKIDEIIDQNGNLVSSMEGVLQTASSYFVELFTASSMGDTAPIYDNVKEKITPAMNTVLLAPFVADEVKVALSTMSPLKASAKSRPSDELVWRCDSTGVYSPKSGYRLLSESAIHHQSLSLEAYSSLFYSFFSSLWELQVPAKCKIFMWRLMHNFIPTFANLCFRKLAVRNLCPLCELHVDTTAHMLFSCTFTQQILSLVGLPSIITVHNQDFTANFATWFLQADKKNKQVIVLTFWTIWFARNNLIHEGTVCSVTKVSTFVLAYLRELDSIAALAIPAKLSKDVKWIPPVGDFVKLNFDASFDSALKASVSGIIARDSYGLILAACYSHHSGVADAFIAEAFACEKAVSLAIDLGFRSVQVEGDSLTIIKKLQSASVDKSVISPIINDIRVLMGSFEEITFSFVNRAGNAAAHELARLGTHQTESRFWIEEAPASVEQIVECERSR